MENRADIEREINYINYQISKVEDRLSSVSDKLKHRTRYAPFVNELQSLQKEKESLISQLNG